MRIADSNTALAAEYSVQESYKTSVSRETELSSGDNTVATGVLENSTEVSISKEGLDMLNQDSGGVARLTYSASAVGAKAISSIFVSSKQELQLRLLTRLLEGLTGKKIPFSLLASDFSRKLGETKDSGGSANQLSIASLANNQAGLPVTRSQVTTTIETGYQREDRMTFGATEQVLTADGMKIDLAISLSMSRSFTSSQSISWTTEDVRLCDPLVFNFNGLGVELAGETFSFDIDNDGTSDQISLLAEGNGFLALDLNGDGTINNGSELFGTNSGNGFADLAVYDADGNGWIDENDDIFDKLQIMFVDKEGNQKLFALGELGIGAIYLGNVQSDFELRDGQNNTQGVITHTGFFLYESGNSGLVQNVNFRMYDTPTEPALLYDAAV